MQSSFPGRQGEPAPSGPGSSSHAAVARDHKTGPRRTLVLTGRPGKPHKRPQCTVTPRTHRGRSEWRRGPATAVHWPIGPEATYAARMRFAPAVIQTCAGVTWRRPRTAQQCSRRDAPASADRGALAVRPRPDVAVALVRG